MNTFALAGVPSACSKSTADQGPVRVEGGLGSREGEK